MEKEQQITIKYAHLHKVKMYNLTTHIESIKEYNVRCKYNFTFQNILLYCI